MLNFSLEGKKSAESDFKVLKYSSFMHSTLLCASYIVFSIHNASEPNGAGDLPKEQDNHS